MDFSVESHGIKNDLMKVAKGLLAHGVTSFCPTIVTSLRETYEKVCTILLVFIFRINVTLHFVSLQYQQLFKIR